MFAAVRTFGGEGALQVLGTCAGGINFCRGYKLAQVCEKLAYVESV